MPAANETDPWSAWLAQFGPRLLLFARHQARHPDDAEDLLQEACLRVWRGNGDSSAIPPPGRFFLAIRQAAVDAARRDGRRSRREARFGETAETCQQFECPVDGAEQRAGIGAALDRLPQEQREVLVLHIWGEQSFREIAAILGIPPDTAASRYRYALSHLRKDLTVQPTP